MIPKEISQTPIPNPKYILYIEKEIIKNSRDHLCSSNLEIRISYTNEILITFGNMLFADN
jgi:hypothetical protein